MADGAGLQELAAQGADRGGGSGRGDMQLSPRTLFIWLGVLAVTAIVAFRGPALLAARDQALQQRQTQAATLAQFAANYSARLYDQSSRVARDVAQHVRQEDLSDAELEAWLAKRVGDTSADDYIVLLDTQGRVRASSEEVAAQPAAYRLGEDQKRWTTPQQRVLPVMKSRLTGAVIYPLIQGLQDRAGAFAGVVGVNVRPEGIQPTAKRKPDQPLLTVWDQQGRFVAASFVDFDDQGRPIAPPMPPGLGVPGSAREGAHDLVASTPVPGWPLVAAASFDRSGVLAAWRREVYQTVGLLVLASFGVLALVMLGIRTAEREAGVRRELERSMATAEAALRDRDLLMQEVHHRVKNSLLMTASLLYLQERRFNDPAVRDAFESTRRRLSSIGLVHEALYSGSSREDVDLAQYLDRLLAEVGEAYGALDRGVRMSGRIEPIMLPAAQATPVGLIVTEVVTNALKHAFAGRPAGEVAVVVKRTGIDEVQLEVRDDGAGYPDEGQAGHGLGSRLIDSLTDQLRGRVEKSTEGGAVFRLWFPLTRDRAWTPTP